MMLEPCAGGLSGGMDHPFKGLALTFGDQDRCRGRRNLTLPRALPECNLF